MKEEYLNERSHYRNKETLSTRQNNSISSLFYINRDIENLFSTRYRERKERGKENYLKSKEIGNNTNRRQRGTFIKSDIEKGKETRKEGKGEREREKIS